MVTWAALVGVRLPFMMVTLAILLQERLGLLLGRPQALLAVVLGSPSFRSGLLGGSIPP